MRTTVDTRTNTDKAWSLLQWFGAAVVVVAAVLMLLPARAYGAGSQGTVTAPASPAGPYTDGQVITVSGTGFSTRSSGNTIQILECADPGGTAPNLPQDNSTCDGSTINSTPIVPTTAGGFTTQYTITKLSSTGSSPSPIDCNATNYCVLWIGEDYNGNFTGSSAQPVAFSPPFVVNDAAAGGGGGGGGTTVPPAGTTTGGGPVPSGGASGPITTSSGTTSSSTGSTGPTTSASGTPSTATDSSTGASAATSADTSSGPSLALTGPPRLLPALVGLGGLMMVVGAGARRRLAPSRR